MASLDTPEVNKDFAEKESADFPILSDPGKATANAYGVIASPDKPYASRWTFYIGPDGKILDIDKKVKPQTAGNDLAAKLEALKVVNVK